MRAKTLTMAARLDATAAKPLLDALLTRRGAPLDLRIDHVERITTSSLQVLLSAAATWRADGQAKPQHVSHGAGVVHGKHGPRHLLDPSAVRSSRLSPRDWTASLRTSEQPVRRSR